MSLACKESEEQINLICHIYIHIHWWFWRHCGNKFWIHELYNKMSVQWQVNIGFIIN